MKKITTLFLLLTFIGLTQAQTQTKSKQKPIEQKDSIKKINIAETQPSVTDTLVVETTKYKLYKKNAHASYYADKFHGRRTASGKRYDKNKLTAAHRKLPLGTRLKVTNDANGKSVVVEVTDRGPFARGREIDLSKRAFMEITSNRNSGAVNVTIAVAE